MSAVLDTALFTEVFVTLFVIMDPPGTVPVFLGLTSAMGAKQRNRAARQAILVAFGVIVVFALFGQQVLHYMGITLPALQASGGLLLLLIAMELLTGKMEEPSPSGNKGVNVALVPLGTPLLAGPGAIVATMVFVQQTRVSDSGGAPQLIAIAVAIVLVHVCLYLSMRFANVIHRVLRESGVTLVTRIAGLLLAAIAVQQIATAVTEFVKMAQ
ncbi:MarC family protein [Isoptericola sp. NPDC056573]|uniref:MarC family protein n=1 Tax=unclassified Isoptericola TaxID=2623355 RepID=UPI0036C91AE3